MTERSTTPLIGKEHARPLHVYVAGPLSNGDWGENIHRATLAAMEVNDVEDCFAFLPHLFFYLHVVSPRGYEYWMRQCFAWILRCDALLRIPGESSGADREIEFARSHGIPVFDSLADLKVWAQTARTEKPSFAWR